MSENVKDKMIASDSEMPIPIEQQQQQDTLLYEQIKRGGSVAESGRSGSVAGGRSGSVAGGGGADQKSIKDENSQKLCMNFLQVFLRTVLRIIMVGITIAIPISLIGMGVTYLNDCKSNSLIPVFILIMGALGVVKQILNLFTLVRGKENQAEESKRHSPTQILINCFLLGCLIICSYWIYKEYPPKELENGTISCDETFYYFSFWMITTVYIVMGIGIFVLCAATIVFLWIDRKMLLKNSG